MDSAKKAAGAIAYSGLISSEATTAEFDFSLRKINIIRTWLFYDNPENAL
jgi:hypothetical protein